MKGATAVPWLKIIKTRNNKKTIIIGRSQYFFLVNKKYNISFKKLITLFFAHNYFIIYLCC